MIKILQKLRQDAKISKTMKVVTSEHCYFTGNLMKYFNSLMYYTISEWATNKK